MAASPNSVAATSDIEPPSSPAAPDGKSFVSRAGSEDEDTRMAEDNPDKPHRSKSKGSQSKDANGQQNIGKIRHLKKEDGEPLWREDIQYDFLRAVFDNEQKVFTNTYDPDGIGMQTFADLYIDTMSRSSKTSKVLRDKLLSDREAAKGMAMVCLLVNVGRMNTTLNFFPEMRAQLRTYHAIPSLQAHQDPHAYKQLQDAPRLKSILKGGAEDREEPNSLDKIKKMDNPPRTNPVNLIFVMCSGAQKIAELHFPLNHEFHDLIMKTNYSSESRAKAFLWLMWFYLESDFTEEGCDENPFGPGVDYGLDVANQGVPELELLTDEQKIAENVDTPEETEFGREKQKTRAKILEMDQAYLNERESKRGKLRAPLSEDGPAILPRIRPSKHESDMDSTRSTPPPKALARSGASGRRGLPLKYQIFEGSSPARHGSEGVVSRKPRPPTAHQLAVERNRNERVEYILDRGLRKRHHKSRKLRRQDGAIFRAYRRLQAQEDGFEDSDGDEDTPRNLPPNSDKGSGPFREKGLGGLCLMTTEDDDFGEEVSSYAAALRRSTRRLARWKGHETELGVIAPIKKPRPNGETAENGDDGDAEGGEHAYADAEASKANGDASGDITMGDVTMGDVTMDDVEADAEDADQIAVADEEGRADDDADDGDKTEVMGESDVD
ncbi:ino eighty subunit 1 [Hirsutella rhossiliensis]|uniref:Ino eighty subunit 1 n=1 Tax=Hirsutella rhossiliensis TaxID=111463 RepID=A0A9P8N192_9HYPO|nr:ino eighty subunit 1 [Hirsutella rhossiliensis]KAH0965072.1 ino eighty subunit 1 [Hirsutella rhossiliensis]